MLPGCSSLLLTVLLAASVPGALGFLPSAPSLLFSTHSTVCSSVRTRPPQLGRALLPSLAPRARQQCVAVLAVNGEAAASEEATPFALRAEPQPLVICGPSGVGKGTLIALLRQVNSANCSILCLKTSKNRASLQSL